MEIYQGGEQSIDSYPDYDEWLSRYWEDTVALCYLVLNKGGRFGLIVNNYVSLKKQEYNLIQDLNIIALKYLKLVGVYNLLNRVSPLRMNKKKRTEMLFIYEK
jgi:predicted acetyltransferase